MTSHRGAIALHAGEAACRYRGDRVSRKAAALADLMDETVGIMMSESNNSMAPSYLDAVSIASRPLEAWSICSRRVLARTSAHR
jgi:hypothetical protein